MNNNEKFTMKRSGIVVTEVCSLNCRLCGTYSPYRTCDYFPPVSELCEYIDRYMKIVDYCEHFTFTGGEPLLYKGLSDLIDYFFSNYSQKIGGVEIITNGTIVPNKDLLKTIKKHENKFKRFLIDDYGKELSNKVKEIVIAIEEYSLPYEVRENNSNKAHCGGWVDYGTLDKQIHSLDEAISLYNRCSERSKKDLCFPILFGKMEPCAPVGRRISFGTALANEYVDLMDDSLTIEEQRQKLRDIFSSPLLETCKYCNGLCDDSPRFTPAEQLTLEEIKELRRKRN